MEREPCLWMQTGQDHEHLRSETVMVNGRPVKRRFPQRGSQGDYEDMRPASGIRFVYFVNDYGNTIPMVLTCGAAHLDHTTGFGQYQLAQARFLGYYQPGQCPCALRATGELAPHHISSDEVRNGKPCDAGSFSFEKPCKHSIAEKQARLDRTREDFLATQRQYKGEGVNATEDAVTRLTNIVETLAHKPEGGGKK